MTYRILLKRQKQQQYVNRTEITEQSEEQKLEKFDFQKKIALKPESKIVKHT